MVVKGVNEANLPRNSKFLLTVLEWDRDKISKRSNYKGNFVETDETFTSDATITENYTQSSDVVTYPVEAGYPVADMSQMTDFNVVISAVNSNTPFSAIELFEDPLQSLAGSLVGSRFEEDRENNFITRVQAAYDTLEKWQRRGILLSLRCKYALDGYRAENGDIRPFVISSLSITRNTETGDAIGYTLTLQQIFVARLSLTVDALVRLKPSLGEQGLKENETVIDENGPTIKKLNELDQQKISQDSGKFEILWDAVKKAATGN